MVYFITVSGGPDHTQMIPLVASHLAISVSDALLLDAYPPAPGSKSVPLESKDLHPSVAVSMIAGGSSG
jgi:hypothetical protein